MNDSDDSLFNAADELVARSGPLTVFRREAMASDFEIAFNDVVGAEGEDSLADAALDALDEVDRVEDALSVFRSTSALSRVNLLASEMNVRVDDELWNWLETALRISRETDGAFDVTTAPLWRAWGFAKRDGEFPDEETLARAKSLTGARHLRLDEIERSIAFDEEGVELNFGGIGKGIALDVAVSALERRGVGDFLIQGGKSGVVARGGRVGDFAFELVASGDSKFDDDYDEESGFRRRASSSRGGKSLGGERNAESFEKTSGKRKMRDGAIGWTIGVAHPLAPERRIAEIWLKDRALSTSGSTYQFFRSGGKRYSHIIDPRTGMPTSGALATTALAPTATEADALSTAFFVLGAEKSREFCERRKDVGALFVLEREAYPGYEIATFNLDDESWRALG